ncbi:type II secretion system protein GspL [Aliidiomarina sp. Khilg15.8]
MTKILIIRLSADAEGNIPWLLWDEEMQAAAERGTLNNAAELSQLSELSTNVRVQVLCASTDVGFHELELPPGSRKHLHQVVPYALEESLAQDIDELHFAWQLPAAKDAPLPVAVVAKELMTNWHAWLTQAGIDYQSLVPDLFALPLATDEWTAGRIDDDIIVRHSDWRGFAIEAGLFVELAGLFSNELTPPQRIRCWGEIEWPQAPAELTPADDSDLLSMARHISSERSINLIQGGYRNRQKRQVPLAVWRWPAIAAVALLAIFVVEKGVYWWQLNTAQTQLTQTIEKTYLDTFPEETRLVNVRAQLGRHLSQLQSGGGDSELLYLLNQLAPAFAQTDLTVTLMQYDNSRNELRIQANGPNFLMFEQFQTLAREQDLNIEQGQMNSRQGQIAGTLIIRGGA